MKENNNHLESKIQFALPTYEIQTPKPKLLAALKIVSDQPKQKITKKEMAQIAEDQKIITINAEARKSLTSKICKFR